VRARMAAPLFTGDWVPPASTVFIPQAGGSPTAKPPVVAAFQPMPPAQAHDEPDNRSGSYSTDSTPDGGLAPAVPYGKLVPALELELAASPTGIGGEGVGGGTASGCQTSPSWASSPLGQRFS
jgi:hypothetical protein